MSKYLVQSVTKASTKRGKEYLRFKLFEAGGKSWPGVLWEIPLSIASDPSVIVGKIVDVVAEEGSFAGEAQLDIKALRVTIDEPSDLFLPKSSQSVDKLLSELHGFIDQVNDDHLRRLLKRATEDPRWRRAPAAMRLHHAYISGLLEHTVNLCRLVNVVAPLYPLVRKDLLYTAAVLHDVGKLEELTCGTNLDYSDSGNLLGHIVIGLLWVDRWMDELAFPDELRLLVRHIIISHHGQAAFGSPKPPQIIEAQLFSSLDGLDASMGSIIAAINEAAPTAVWTKETNKYQRIYLGEKNG